MDRLAFKTILKASGVKKEKYSNNHDYNAVDFPRAARWTWSFGLEERPGLLGMVASGSSWMARSMGNISGAAVTGCSAGHGLNLLPAISPLPRARQGLHRTGSRLARREQAPDDSFGGRQHQFQQ